MAAFTFKEAAQELRISVRSFQEIVRRHPFYYPNGNRKLFTEENLAEIRTALVEEQLNSNTRSGAARRAVYAGPSADAALEGR